MNKTYFRLSMLFVILAASFMLFSGLKARSESNIVKTYVDEALMLARYFVGLLPMNPQAQKVATGEELLNLTIEIAGRNTLMYTTDLLYIMPPGQLIDSNTTFTFEPGTQVRLYFVSTTPPPISDPEFAPVQIQKASFLGFDAASIDLIMDKDKTIRIGYSTQVLMFPGDARQYEPRSSSEIADIN